MVDSLIYYVGTVIMSMGIGTSANLVNCDQLNRIWQDKYYSEFQITWEKERFPCPSVSSRIAMAFHYLDIIDLIENGSGVAPDFYKFVKENSPKGFRYEKYSSKHQSRSIVGYACVGCTITLLRKFTIFSIRDRVDTLVHEARHTQRNDPSHVTCERGPLKGASMGCDEALYTGQEWRGSGYNYGFRFHWWLRDSSYGHDLSRTSAGYAMKWSVVNRFNRVRNEDVRRFSK